MPRSTISTRSRRRLLRSALLLGLAPGLLTGCIAAAVGVAAGSIGVIAYANGELLTTERIALGDAWEATLQAVETLELRVEQKPKDGLSGQVTARTADGTKVTIKLTRQSAELTDLSIRVGVFGDRAKSQQILAEIKSQGGIDG